MAIRTLAGQSVLDTIHAEQAAKVPKVGDCYRSQELCALQVAQAARGFCGAQMCKSIYGWTLRYASGLENFSIIARFPAERNGIHGIPASEWEKSYRACLQFATQWANEYPTHRYVITHEEI